MRESKIERPASRYAKSRGWFEVKIMRANKRGINDRVYVRNGVHLWVEYKATGEEPTVQQAKRHRELREHGATVHAVDSLEQAYELFR